MDKKEKKDKNIETKNKKWDWNKTWEVVWSVAAVFALYVWVSRGIIWINHSSKTPIQEYSTQEMLQQYMPDELLEESKQYNIPVSMLENDKDIVILILNSKSIWDKADKQEWFNMYYMMDQKQIDTLRDILTREKAKFDEIDKKNLNILEDWREAFKDALRSDPSFEPEKDEESLDPIYDLYIKKVLEVVDSEGVAPDEEKTKQIFEEIREELWLNQSEGMENQIE